MAPRVRANYPKKPAFGSEGNDQRTGEVSRKGYSRINEIKNMEFFQSSLTDGTFKR